VPLANRYCCPRCRNLRTRGEDCPVCQRNEAERAKWRALTWSEFCAWLTGRRVRRETASGFNDSQVFYEPETGARYGAEFESTYLDFEDGSRARLTSNLSPPTPHYSDVTPGGPGNIELPTVMVREPDPDLIYRSGY